MTARLALTVAFLVFGACTRTLYSLDPSPEGCTGDAGDLGAPLGWWAFDEGDGTTTRDGEGLANGLLVGGAAFQTDVPVLLRARSTHSLALRGAGAYVSLTRDAGEAVRSTDYTFCLWLRAIEATREQNLASEDRLGTVTLQGKLSVGFDHRALIESERTVTDDRWHHACVIRSFRSNELRVDVDGVPTGPVPDTTGPLGAPVLNAFGRDPAGAYPFEGALDEVVIYGRALSVDATRRLFAGQPPHSSCR